MYDMFGVCSFLSWGWCSYLSYSYLVSAVPADQSTARSACQGMKADLVSLGDQNEINFLDHIMYACIDLLLSLLIVN